MTNRKDSRTPALRPFDSRTGHELEPAAQPGYYPGYSTLSQKNFWDEATRRAVTAHATEVPPIRFFTPEEAHLLSAIIARMLPQDDRTPERQIPIFPVIDERLYKNELNGFRYDDMPPDRDAYRLGLKIIDEMARRRFHAPFPELSIHRQELLLKSIHDGRPDPAHSAWKKMSCHRFWVMLLGDCVSAYYSHPWSWDEIGYGGPAYPRGYMRLENGLPEPWEVDEVRYLWNAPADSLSQLDRKFEPPDYGVLLKQEDTD